MAGLTLLALFNYSFVLLTNPRGFGSLDLLITPAQGAYGLETTANVAGLTGIDDPAKFIGQLIGAALSLLGVLFLALMVYGGYLWMTARGNEDQIKKAKEIIIAAVTGLAIVLAAYAITSFVMSNLTK
ncbi:MAG: hypothetical protein V1692_02910 [bacterium]